MPPGAFGAGNAKTDRCALVVMLAVFVGVGVMCLVTLATYLFDGKVDGELQDIKANVRKCLQNVCKFLAGSFSAGCVFFGRKGCVFFGRNPAKI